MLSCDNISLVDTDFAIHASNVDLPLSRIKEIFSLIEEKVGMLYVHPLVFKNEWKLELNPRLKKIVDENVFNFCSLYDFFERDSDEEKYYRIYTQNMIKKVSSLVIEEKDILTTWITGKSFGEIHSLILCLVCDCACFLSDDNDSRYVGEIIKKEYGEVITIYNRSKLADILYGLGLSFMEANEFQKYIKSYN